MPENVKCAGNLVLACMRCSRDPDSLTRAALLITMCAGATLLVRRIITCVVLVALAGIYAVPLAAAFASSDMDCCAAGMCPRPGRSLARHQTHEEMPDCGVGSPSGSLRKCDMGACSTRKDSAVNVGLFVLSAPMRIVRSGVQVPVFILASQSEHAVSQIPETPPPRIPLS
jgi:hypothetical protein